MAELARSGRLAELTIALSLAADLAEELPWHRRVGRVMRAMADPGMDRRSLSGHCDVAARLGQIGDDPAPGSSTPSRHLCGRSSRTSSTMRSPR